MICLKDNKGKGQVSEIKNHPTKHHTNTTCLESQFNNLYDCTRQTRLPTDAFTATAEDLKRDKFPTMVVRIVITRGGKTTMLVCKARSLNQGSNSSDTTEQQT